jgi:hypothetical protein
MKFVQFTFALTATASYFTSQESALSPELIKNVTDALSVLTTNSWAGKFFQVYLDKMVVEGGVNNFKADLYAVDNSGEEEYESGDNSVL